RFPIRCTNDAIRNSIIIYDSSGFTIWTDIIHAFRVLNFFVVFRPKRTLPIRIGEINALIWGNPQVVRTIKMFAAIVFINYLKFFILIEISYLIAFFGTSVQLPFVIKIHAISSLGIFGVEANAFFLIPNIDFVLGLICEIYTTFFISNGPFGKRKFII